MSSTSPVVVAAAAPLPFDDDVLLVAESVLGPEL